MSDLYAHNKSHDRARVSHITAPARTTSVSVVLDYINLTHTDTQQRISGLEAQTLADFGCRSSEGCAEARRARA